MKKTIYLVFIATLFITVISSCSKTPNPNAQFLGTYYGSGNVTTTAGLTPYNDTFTISASPSSSSGILISGSPASNPYYLSATVSGNVYTLTPNQAYGSTSGITLTSGSGTLSGNIISYTYNGIASGSSFTLGATVIKQ